MVCKNVFLPYKRNLWCCWELWDGRIPLDKIHLQFGAEQFHLSICYCCLRGLQVKHPQLPTMPAMLANTRKFNCIQLNLINPDLLQQTCWEISFIPTPTICCQHTDHLHFCFSFCYCGACCLQRLFLSFL